MELRHIRYFLAVADERNFTRAATRIGIGQPPLSQQIRDLEAEVGTALFHRVPHGAELTDAGRAFHDIVQGFPAQAARAIHAARRAARGETGVLRVGFTGTAAFDPVVQAAIRSFRGDYPEVELTLEEANTTRLVAGLSAGELDAVFLRATSAESEALQLRQVSAAPMIAVLPEHHPAAASSRLRLEALRDEAFILTPRPVGPTLFDIVIAACRDAGFEPTLGQVAPQISSVVSLVAAGLGVSVVPASMRQLQLAGVVYREIDGDGPVARLSLACRRSDSSGVVRNFIRHAVG